MSNKNIYFLPVRTFFATLQSEVGYEFFFVLINCR